MWWPLLVCLIQLLIIVCLSGEDYYQLLGITKEADERTIRRAFKKIAIVKHPDRDPDNPDAHNNFIQINRAYEVLKDPDLRKKYDQYGEEGLNENKNAGQQYESWNFYNEKFGIYDDDAEIATLTRQDFQHLVTDSGDVWFINFYSTFCSHCHQLAPTWREFAKKMEGIIKIGAVNCAEDPHLCQSQHVRAYPSLVAYPDHLFFQGQREVEPLIAFITAKLKVELIQVTKRNVESLSTQWEPYNQRPWLIDFCDEMENCFKQTDRRVIAYMLDKTVNVGTIMCHAEAKDKLCDELQRSEGLAYYPAGQINIGHEMALETFELKEVYQQVLRLLPDIPPLNEETYRSILDGLEDSKSEEMLVLFVSKQVNVNNELKKLRPLIASTTKFSVADCSLLSDGCGGMHLGSLPKLVFFRPEGNHLIYYGKTIGLSEARSFLASARKSTLISLSEIQFDEIKTKQEDPSTSDLWLVDLFAPWCSPCIQSINELNSLPHTLNGRRLRVGIVDCDTHKQFCQNRGVNSYPTTMLLFGKSDQRLIGFHSLDQIIDFIQETLHPSVIELGPQEFEHFVVQKPDNEIYVVDFFAPWCGPCQQLTPEFRKLARIVQEETDSISFGSVDCDAHRHLCQSNGVNKYPTVRVYVNGGKFDYPDNWWRNAESMKQWISSFLPTNVEALNEERLIELMEVEQKMPVVIDYYANWCSHCHQFAPVFDQASRMLENRVLFGKIDCAEFPNACARAAIQAYPTVKLYSPGRRTLNAGIRIHALDAARLVDIINRVLGQHSYNEFDHIRDEL